MKKYVTFVKNAEESRKVQEALFKARIKWCTGDKSYREVTTPTILFVDGNSEIFVRVISEMFDSSYDNAVDETRRELLNYTFCDTDEMVSVAEHATPPEKMHTIDGKEWSESTLKLMIRQWA